MSNEPIRTEMIRHNGLAVGRLEVHVEVGENPRNNDTATALVLFARDRDLPRELEFSVDEFPSFSALRGAIEEKYPYAAILPVYMMEHGTTQLSHTPFKDRFDSGQVGFQVHLGLNFDEQLDARTEELMAKELHEYTGWLNGTVYGIIIKDLTDSRVDGIGQLFGPDSMDEVVTEILLGPGGRWADTVAKLTALAGVARVAVKVGITMQAPTVKATIEVLTRSGVCEWTNELYVQLSGAVTARLVFSEDNVGKVNEVKDLGELNWATARFDLNDGRTLELAASLDVPDLAAELQRIIESERERRS